MVLTRFQKTFFGLLLVDKLGLPNHTGHSFPGLLDAINNIDFCPQVICEIREDNAFEGILKTKVILFQVKTFEIM